MLVAADALYKAAYTSGVAGSTRTVIALGGTTYGIPSYNLLRAQKHMNTLLGKRLVVEPMSFGGVLATLRACKLYDFEKHQWLDFAGQPSARPINLSARGSIQGRDAVLPRRPKASLSPELAA